MLDLLTMFSVDTTNTVYDQDDVINPESKARLRNTILTYSVFYMIVLIPLSIMLCKFSKTRYKKDDEDSDEEEDTTMQKTIQNGVTTGTTTEDIDATDYFG